MKIHLKILVSAVLMLFTLGLATTLVGSTQAAEQSGSIGIEGTVPGNPPAQAPTITIPRDGQVFTSIPITVSGLCQSGLLVQIFKNNVFAGSVTCQNGSYSLQIDLFSGLNDLVARQYDALNQASPDSATVSVTFNDGTAASGPRISIFSAYAKRGADKDSALTWPLTISGGQAPYAVSVDWGDKTTPDLFTRQAPGEFTIEHTYKQAGIYNIVIKATDANGVAAFLQVVGIANGPIAQTPAAGGQPAEDKATEGLSSTLLWILAGVAIVLFAVSFWLGKKHQLQHIRSNLRKGKRPF
jgi:hypothetical protein